MLMGGSGSTPISASTFRFAVDRALGWNKIRSDLYEVRNAGEQIVFSGRGSGHGVGMCQAGAEEMAREGKNYREILSFYYPRTQLGSTGMADGAKWQKRSSERIGLLSTQPDVDSKLLPIAERILKEDEEAIGWKASAGVQLQVYATLDSYRNTTGQPGWVAASTRGKTIRLQPLAELQKRAIVEMTLRHEIFHVLVEMKAKAATPLWFREGMVLFLSNPDAAMTAAAGMTDEQIEAVLQQPRNRDEVQRAYAAAQSRVALLIKEHGKETVLGWLSAGIPSDIRVSSGGALTCH
jgi:stage II sporulation protein D